MTEEDKSKEWSEIDLVAYATEYTLELQTENQRLREALCKILVCNQYDDSHKEIESIAREALEGE